MRQCESCGNCAAWVANGPSSHAGTCRRKAPTANRFADGSLFPPMMANGWCMEHTPLETELPLPAVLQFHYRNHRGEEAMRTVEPVKLYYGDSKWHGENLLLLEARDLDRDGAVRTFAVRDILAWETPNVV